MARKIISIIIAIVALILLFLLIRAAVGAFTNDPEPDVPTQTEATISDPIENGLSVGNPNTANGGNNTPNANAPGASSTTGNGTGTGNTPAAPASGNQELANAGPAETAMVTIAVTSALGTMLYVRRRQLANL